jgi:hypothetical protein
MRKADLKKNHKLYEKWIGKFRVATEKYLKATYIISTVLEKRLLAETMVVRLCGNWEYLINEDLVSCVNKHPSKLSEYFGVKISKHPSKNLCRALIIGAGYKDFKNCANLIDYSKKVISDGCNPFPKISAANRKKVDEAFIIRNYVLHLSAVSKRRLKDIYTNDYKLRKFIEPGKFLLANKALRIWQYFKAFESAGNDIKKHIGIK